MGFDFAAWSQERQSTMRTSMDKFIVALDTGSNQLKLAMRHSLQKGKFIRSLLLFATAEIFATPFTSIIKPACAVELIHTYSLIHDDLPAMDDDDFRRGNPSCHIKYDEATAILAGDAMQALAFNLLSTADIDATTKIKLVKILSDACGAPGMVGGQALDMELADNHASLIELENMYSRKTAALITAAICMGLVLSQADTAENTGRFNELGHKIGLLFQIQDDILDVAADTQTLGKPAGSDVINAKSTFVSILGIAKAREATEKYHTEILDNLHKISGNTAALIAICDFILKRKF